jgi:hypothetical protein
MFRRGVLFFVIFQMVFSFSTVLASEIKESFTGDQVEVVRKGGARVNKVDRLLCIGGVEVLQTIAFGYADGSGVAVSNLQLMEEKNGKVVPVRCDSEK